MRVNINYKQYMLLENSFLAVLDAIREFIPNSSNTIRESEDNLTFWNGKTNETNVYCS